MKMTNNKFKLILLVLFFWIFVGMFVTRVQQDPQKKQKLAQDTMKVDTLSVKMQQKILMEQSKRQLNELDSIKAKLKKK